MREWRHTTLAAAGAAVAGLALAALVAAGGASAPAYETPSVDQPIQSSAANPCADASRRLRCPDVKMGRPRGLYITHGHHGRVLLHATSSLNVRGDGPLEVRGRRSGRRGMVARQRILRRHGKPLLLPATGAHLAFYAVPGQGRYWKFHQAARFEIWSVDSTGHRDRLLRIGPKLYYCFRDLKRTRPSRRSPRRAHYPSCSQNPHERRVTLGTSLGWSDIYPASYNEQWINVSGLHGCFSFALMADPQDHLRELNERNNRRARLIRLPGRGGARGCRRR